MILKNYSINNFVKSCQKIVDSSTLLEIQVSNIKKLATSVQYYQTMSSILSTIVIYNRPLC